MTALPYKPPLAKHTLLRKNSRRLSVLANALYEATVCLYISFTYLLLNLLNNFTKILQLEGLK